MIVTMPDDKSGDQQRPAYEQARDELNDLVRQLEAGGLTLEQALQLWERGERLAAICEEWLEGARARLASAMARQESDSAGPGADARTPSQASPAKSEPSAPF
jgi:exodeoxyribonuclease VII small subunit